MSRFDGLPDDLVRDERESYEPGTLAYDPDFVDRLVNTFFETYSTVFRLVLHPSQKSNKVMDLMEEAWESYNALIKGELPAVLEHSVDLDAQGFLDAVMKGLDDGAPGATTLSPPTRLIDEVITALYTAGHNDLMINPTEAVLSESKICSDLKGTGERALRLVCRLPPSPGEVALISIGSDSEYCILHVLGNATYVGSESAYCDFTLEGKGITLGQEAISCAYRLAGVDRIKLGSDFLEPAGIQQIVFAYDRGDRRYISMLPLDFFENGNTLLIPDGNSGWKEVTP